MQTKPSRFGRIVRFCIGGAAGVSANYLALYCLTEYLHVWYIASAVFGFILNTGINFTMQKFWTFKNKEKRMVGRQLAQYVTMTISFFLGNAGLLYVLVEYAHIWYIWAQGILTVFFSILSYFITGWIFRNEKTRVPT